MFNSRLTLSRFRPLRAAGALTLVLLPMILGCGSRGAGKSAMSSAPDQRGDMATTASTMIMSPRAANMAAPATPEMEAMGAGGESHVVAAAAPGRRRLVRNVSLSIAVVDVDSVARRVEAMIALQGGFVAQSQRENRAGFPCRNYTLRVPGARLDTTLTALRGMAVHINGETQGVEDVTGQVVDIEARLRALRAAEVELFGMLKDARAHGGKVEDVMSVYHELVGIRTQIEQYDGQLASLEELAALSTVHLELVPDAASGPVQPQAWRPAATLKDDLRQLVSSLRGIGDAAIWFAVVMLPLGVIVGGVALLGFALVRRFAWRRRTTA